MGVIIATATESTNCCSLSQAYSFTTPAYKKGTIAKPLPKTKAPALPKNRKIFHKTESVESKIVMFRKANERELNPNDLGGNL
jgi:hypothetical protein